jgi:RimJ/RimL family protein N-acetyltransferase
MAPAGEMVTLADGGTVLVRELHAADRAGYAEGVGALSDRSRYQRFATPKPRLSDRELDYLTHVDGVRHVALVALDGEHGVAVARYVRHGEGLAEVAIGVADAWQRRGLGRELLVRLVEKARSAPDLRALDAMTLADNRAAQGLLRSVGFAFDRRDGVLLVYVLAL